MKIWIINPEHKSVRYVVALVTYVLLVILFLVGLAHFPAEYVIGISVVLFFGITFIYRTGRQDAIEAYNKTLIREGTWIRVTKDITVKTQIATFTLRPYTIAYVTKVSKHGSSYDILIDPRFASYYPHTALQMFDNYRNVTIVPVQDVDKELQELTLKELEEL